MAHELVMLYYARHSRVAFALSIVFFVYLGQWLDRRLGTEPWMLLLGLLLGAGGSFYGIYRKLMADLRREEERKKG